MSSVSVRQASMGPYMTQERFAEVTGVSLDVVRGWVKKGYLPIFDLGKYRLINVALLTKEALEQEYKV